MWKWNEPITEDWSRERFDLLETTTELVSMSENALLILAGQPPLPVDEPFESPMVRIALDPSAKTRFAMRVIMATVGNWD